MRDPNEDVLRKVFPREVMDDKLLAKELPKQVAEAYLRTPIKNKFVTEDGSAVPDHCDVLEVGERLQVKRGWYEVVGMSKERLVLKPVLPTDQERAVEAEIQKLVKQVKAEKDA